MEDNRKVEEEVQDEQIEVTELEDKDLDDVAGGSASNNNNCGC